MLPQIKTETKMKKRMFAFNTFLKEKNVFFFLNDKFNLNFVYCFYLAGWDVSAGGVV